MSFCRTAPFVIPFRSIASVLMARLPLKVHPLITGESMSYKLMKPFTLLKVWKVLPVMCALPPRAMNGASPCAMQMPFNSISAS